MKHPLSILLILLISACSAETVPPVENTEITLTATDSLILLDDLSPIDGVIKAYHPLKNETFILADNKPGIYLFEKGRMIRSFGNIGQGPCEFTDISATDVQENSLYLLTTDQLKIIEFDIQSGECVKEFSHKEMAGITHLLREEGSDSFLAFRGSYSGAQPDSLTLLYRFYPDESIEYLDLNYGRINPIPAVINFRTPGSSFNPFEDGYYFYPPQTDSVFRYDPDSGSLTAFAHDVNLNRTEIEQVGQDFQKMIELMQEEVRFIGRLFASKDWIALESIYENTSDNEEQEVNLRFYTHQGKLIDTKPVSDLIGFKEGDFVQLVENPANTEHPFQLRFLTPDEIPTDQ